MDLSTLEQMLITYIPALTVLIGFLASCFGFMTKIKGLLKESNVDEIKLRIDDLLVQIRILNAQNEDLKKRNNKLLSELTRIAGYEED